MDRTVRNVGGLYNSRSDPRVYLQTRAALPDSFIRDGVRSAVSLPGSCLTVTLEADIIKKSGGSSSTGRAPDCGSGRCGFDSRLPPQLSCSYSHAESPSPH